MEHETELIVEPEHDPLPHPMEREDLLPLDRFDGRDHGAEQERADETDALQEAALDARFECREIGDDVRQRRQCK